VPADFRSLGTTGMALNHCLESAPAIVQLATGRACAWAVVATTACHPCSCDAEFGGEKREFDFEGKREKKDK
jgi:hypothetical protein